MSAQRALRQHGTPWLSIIQPTLASIVLLTVFLALNLATPALAQEDSLLVLSRIQYDGNTFGNPANYPYIYNDPTVSGVQGSIHLDVYLPFPNTPTLFSSGWDHYQLQFEVRGPADALGRSAVPHLHCLRRA
jgi:hypothetical protein